MGGSLFETGEGEKVILQFLRMFLVYVSKNAFLKLLDGTNKKKAFIIF